MPNRFAFIAITADDVERARAFYEQVFGWTFEDWGPPDFYIIHGAGFPGALQKRHEPIVGTHPRSFEISVAVDDVDATAKKVKAAGGAIVMAKTKLDGVGTLVHFTDTEGNRVGAMQYENFARHMANEGENG
jgi:predicted enzyme related to lactoylglutathione lyase